LPAGRGTVTRMEMTLEELRRALGGSPVTLRRLEAVLGADGVHELRRFYFPRWRRGRAHAASESLRDFKEVAVESEFEAEIVSALAPQDVRVKIRIAEPA
jgi:hypothetical protein